MTTIEEEPKPDTDEPEDPKDDPEAENFAMRVERQVRKALGGLIGKGEVKVEEGGEGAPSESAGDGQPTPPSAKVEEASAEESVRQALQKITAEDEHAKEHARIRENERAPQVVSKVTRFVWGDP